MTASLPPSIVFIGGALLIPLVKGRVKKALMLALPLWALATVATMPEGGHWSISFLDYDLILGRIDRLSRIFAIIFSIISFISFLFALRVDDDLQHASAMAYAGGALGVALAGDFFSLYVFWEVMAVASTFVILARRTKSAQAAAFRYVLIHLFGGLCLLAGILLRLHRTGSIEVGFIGLSDAASWLIFIGIAVNAAIVPLHAWLKDAYPQATATGAVFLSAFTTKSAVYLMARTFPGTELLIYLGALMTCIPIFYAVLENDIRGVLSYSLINQVGFMMCGIGIGTPLALNGTAAHAFCHIIYKALLFMSAGSVLQQTGKIRCTDLGGLYKTMPLTGLFCMIGAASISAFPLFSGFVSKSMIVSAAGANQLVAVWFMLQFASAGVFHHAGIKVPFFMFFGHDSGIRAKEPPWNMLLAMGIAAFLCIGIAVYPKPLYDLLPYPVDYAPYTAAHVVGQLQILMFGALAFTLLILSGYYPAEMRAINLDTDWFYRVGGKAFYRLSDWVFNGLNEAADRLIAQGLTGRINRFFADGATRLVLAVLRPVWAIVGNDPALAAARKKRIEATLSKGAAPVGASAAGAVILLILALTLS